MSRSKAAATAGDGRRGVPACPDCHNPGDLQPRVDVVDETMTLYCPGCGSDVAVGAVLEAAVEVVSQVEALDDLDPVLRKQVEAHWVADDE